MRLFSLRTFVWLVSVLSYVILSLFLIYSLNQRAKSILADHTLNMLKNIVNKEINEKKNVQLMI
ncbi:hypothetical protein SAMN06269117_11819 [Balnearium lithotrophicum]|uniref:Uncharacterized protein n=1 Tax=Balnearium lithotrophicum TaxID=223788 RepID=A0A521D8J7_9BACT|nr:hypothetical protein SAMN06269117_11819 [Balnearium lithotrophicum]